MGLFNKRNPYDELMGEQYLKILKESVDIFNNTKNPDTFFQRYALAEQHANNLCKLKGAKFIGQQPKQIVKQLSDKKQAAIHDMIDRCFDDATYKASKVKKLDSKISKFASFITVLEEYYHLMSEENVQYVETLYANAISYLSINN